MGTDGSALESLVCAACWNGLFAAEGWQTVPAAK